MRQFNRSFGEKDRFGKKRFSGNSPKKFGMNKMGMRKGPKKDNESHNVICDKCGKECEVPFKPTSGKPIFCRRCFKDKEGSSSYDDSKRNYDTQPDSRDNRRDYRESDNNTKSSQLDEINRKLDEIIEMLNRY